MIAAFRQSQVLDDLPWATDQRDVPVGGLFVHGFPEDGSERVAHDGTVVGIHDARLERLSVRARALLKIKVAHALILILDFVELLKRVVGDAGVTGCGYSLLDLSQAVLVCFEWCRLGIINRNHLSVLVPYLTA